MRINILTGHRCYTDVVPMLTLEHYNFHVRHKNKIAEHRSPQTELKLYKIIGDMQSAVIFEIICDYTTILSN